MNDSPGTPLTDFLIELSHDVEKLQRFTNNREDFLRDTHGLLAKHLEALREGNLNQLLEYVREEHPEDGTLILLSPMAPINCPDP